MKIIYWRYVSLFFIIGVDSSEEVSLKERTRVLQLYSSDCGDIEQLFRQGMRTGHNTEYWKITLYYTGNDAEWTDIGDK